MQIFSHENQTTTEFSFTKEGNFMKTIIGKDFIAMQCTPNPAKFLNWMVSDEIKEEKKQEEEKLKMLKIISFWELQKASECFCGSFNDEHYKKVLSYKSRYFTEAFTSTSRIPKVKLKTTFPNGHVQNI